MCSCLRHAFARLTSEVRAYAGTSANQQLGGIDNNAKLLQTGSNPAWLLHFLAEKG